MWWRDAVIYQVYPRSFQDSDGDGIGDLAGIAARLDHIRELGARAVWLSPFYPSPDADFGYDVADYTAVDPRFGTLDDFDRLIAAAHARGLRVLVDFVPCHSSIEHPWFRSRSDFHVWADSPPNNWRATFGGSAWERDELTGRYYLHSFYPEQADLNWRNPALRAEMADALRFWVAHGVDGFRLDALDRLMKDPELRDDPPASGPARLPAPEDDAGLEHLHSGNAPDIGDGLAAIREAAGDALLVGEVFLPAAELGPYLQVLDVAFAFEAMHASAASLRESITAALDTPKLGWVLSNHDFSRLPSRFGPAARAAALLFLFLPGPVFTFQGDELGMPDGPGITPPHDRAGRDGFRHPMPWDATPQGGFTTGTPWLPVVRPPEGDVAAQQADPGSWLRLFTRATRLRPQLAAECTVLESPPGTIVVSRGEHLLAVNLTAEPVSVRRDTGTVLLEAHPGDAGDDAVLPAHAGWVIRRSGSGPAAGDFG